MISTAELARRWSLHPTTLRKWRRERYGPTPYKIGGKVLYKIDEVREFEAKSRKV